jgi:hypothetical protein
MELKNKMAMSGFACALCQRPLGLRPRLALSDGRQVHEFCHRAVAAPEEAAMPGAGVMQDLQGDDPYCSFPGADIPALEPPAPHDDAAGFQGVLGGPGEGEDDADVVEKASTASTTFMAADAFDGSSDECLLNLEDQGLVAGDQSQCHALSPARHAASPAESGSTPRAAPPAGPGVSRCADGVAWGCVGDGSLPANLLSKAGGHQGAVRTRMALEEPRPHENDVGGTSAPVASSGDPLPGAMPVLIRRPGRSYVG